MVKVEHSVVINRPVEDVFGFIANPENTPLWAGAVREKNDFRRSRWRGLDAHSGYRDLGAQD